MPVPLLKHHFCRRSGNGPKAHAHAAYLSGTKLNTKDGLTADFTPKGGILHAEVWVPASAPEWAKDRGELWRRLEAREDKSTRKAQAILAHKFIGALPHELTLDENIRYVKDFIREQFTRKGYAADWAIHAPDTGSDGRNYHVHIMVPLRKFEQGAWAKNKDRFPKNSPALSLYIKEKQTAFFELQNRYLQKNGIDARIQKLKGKWCVVEGRAIDPFAAMRARRPHILVKPIIRASQQLTPDGGKTLREIIAQSKDEIVSIHLNGLSIGPIAVKGWPPAAIADWNEWGSQDPLRFFMKWPELSNHSPVPTGGRSL